MELTVTKIVVYKKYPELFLLSFAEIEQVMIADIILVQDLKITKGAVIKLDQALIALSIVAELIAKYKRLLYTNQKSQKEITSKIKNDKQIYLRLSDFSTIADLQNELSVSEAESNIRNQIINKLLELNLINDLDAGQKISERLIRKGKPIGYIKSKLRSLGIDEPLEINVDKNIQAQNLQHEIDKYMRIKSNKKHDKNFRNNLISSLIRKGYPLNEVLAAVDTVFAY